MSTIENPVITTEATPSTEQVKTDLHNAFPVTGKIVDAVVVENDGPCDPDFMELYKTPFYGKKNSILTRRLLQSGDIFFEVLREVSVRIGRKIEYEDLERFIGDDETATQEWANAHGIPSSPLATKRGGGTFVPCAICGKEVIPLEFAKIENGLIVAGPEMKNRGVGSFVVKFRKFHGKTEIHIVAGCGLLDCETSHAFKLRGKRFLQDGTVDKSVGILPTHTYQEAVNIALHLSKKMSARIYWQNKPKISPPSPKKQGPEKIKTDQEPVSLFIPPPSLEKARRRKKWEKRKRR